MFVTFGFEVSIIFLKFLLFLILCGFLWRNTGLDAHRGQVLYRRHREALPPVDAGQLHGLVSQFVASSAGCLVLATQVGLFYHLLTVQMSHEHFGRLLSGTSVGYQG